VGGCLCERERDRECACKRDREGDRACVFV